MATGVKLPESYENRNLGKIVDGIFNFNNGTGFLYEKQYDGVRDALESLRSENTVLFQRAMSFVVMNSFQGDIEKFSKAYEKQFNNKDRQAIAEKMRGTIGGLGSEVVQDIICDWNSNSRGLTKGYKPAYMRDVGIPVQSEYLKSIAERIIKVRESDPKFAKDLDKLFKSGAATDLIYPDQWFDKHVQDGDGLAKRDFKNTVASNFRSIDFTAIRELVKLNPLPKTQPTQEQEAALEI